MRSGESRFILNFCSIDLMLSAKLKRGCVVRHEAWIRSTRQHIAELKEHRDIRKGSGLSPEKSVSTEEYYDRLRDLAISQLESVVDLVEGVSRAERP